MTEYACPHCGKPYQTGDEICQNCGFVFPFSTDVLAPGTVLQGRYEIQELSHTGGMGYIYLAKDKKLYDRPCILKQVKEPVKSDADLKKLEEEARRMAKLSHPNVAMILDHFVEGNYYFLVVERISGKTLSEVFAERPGQLNEEEVVNWAISMCDVIAYIHKEGIMHRDISPDNVMVTDEGFIKFVDFGTLRELRYITTKGTAGMGKYGYTPLEQWQGKPVPQSDIFALGATIYYLLAGYLPLSKEYLSGQGPQREDFSPRFPPIRAKNSNISSELEVVLQKALQLDVNGRYSSATELGQALRNLKKLAVEEVPLLSVDCGRLDFTNIRPGSRHTKVLTVTNLGTGRLIGTITTSQPWLKVSQGTIDFEETEQRVLVTVDTKGVASGFNGAGTVNIATNGGKAKVAVTLSTIPTTKQVPAPVPIRAGRRNWLYLLIIGLATLIPLLVVGKSLFYQSQRPPPDVSLPQAPSPVIFPSPETPTVVMDWPMLGGTLQRTGYTRQTISDQLSRQWEYKVGPGDWGTMKAFWRSPTIAANRVLYGSWDGYVHCVDAKEGNLLWKYNVGLSSADSSPTVSGERVFIGSTDYNIYCLNISDGRLIWKYKTAGEVFSSPAVFGESIFVGSQDGNLYCISAAQGTLIWKYTTGGEVFCSPALSGDKVFVGSGDGFLYCLTTDTGRLIWRYKIGGYVSYVAVSGNKVFTVSYDNDLKYSKVYCLDTKQGLFLWEYKWVWGKDLVVHENKVIIDSKGGCNCLDADTGRLIWSQDGHGPTLGLAVASDKVIVAGWSLFYCLNIRDGTLISKYDEIIYGGYGAPAISGGRVFVVSGTGYLRCFGSKKESVAPRATLSEPTLLWKQYEIQAQYKGNSVVASKRKVYAASVVYDDRGYKKYHSIVAVDSGDGKILWKYEPVFSTPQLAISEDKVIVTAGDVYCLNANNGKLIWKRDMSVYSSAPVAFDDRVLVCEGGVLYCLNAANGDIVWQYKTKGETWQELFPAVYRDRVIFKDGGSSSCINAKDGKLIWGKGIAAWGPPAVAQGLIFIPSSYSDVYCLSIEDGRIVWRYNESLSCTTGLAVGGDKLFFGSSFSNDIFCISAKDGKLVWKYKIGGKIHCSPSAVGNKLFVGSDDCNFYCLNADNGTLVWQYPLKRYAIGGETIKSSPAISDGKVFLITSEAFYCFAINGN